MCIVMWFTLTCLHDTLRLFPKRECVCRGDVSQRQSVTYTQTCVSFYVHLCVNVALLLSSDDVHMVFFQAKEPSSLLPSGTLL